LGWAGARSGRAQGGGWVTVVLLHFPGGCTLPPRRCRRSEKEPVTARCGAGPLGFRHARLRRTLPTAGQAAPLLFQDLCPEGAEARYSRRCEGGLRGLQRECEFTGQSRAHGFVRALTPEPCRR